MPRLVWFVLKNGRSVIAGCGHLNREAFQRLMDEPYRWMTLTADASVEFIRGAEIREFQLLDLDTGIPADPSIYHFVAV